MIANTEADVYGGRNHPKRILCTEPSPDVAQALASAFTFIASVEGQGSGNASVSIAEGVVQLGEQLETIQLLRDGLNRTCEVFA